MADIRLPNIPDVTGESIQKDKQLRELLIAIKITLEKMTNTKTTAEFDDLVIND